MRDCGFCRSKSVRVSWIDGQGKMNEAVRKVLKRLHYPIEVMLVCVR